MITVAIWLGSEVAHLALYSFLILASSPGCRIDFLGHHPEGREYRRLVKTRFPLTDSTFADSSSSLPELHFERRRYRKFSKTGFPLTESTIANCSFNFICSITTLKGAAIADFPE